MSELVISNLSKIYPEDVKALDSLSFTIPSHSFVVILGPSGCGKTTLLRLICGLDKPTSGDILINNKSVLTKKPHERKIAMVFQEPSLFPMMKVKDNLYYGLDKSQPIEPITDKLHITELLNRYPEECSKGQQQRISIARALLHHPDFYLFDEPLANLDTPLKFELIDVIQRIYQESTASFIYVTHDQTEAQLLATQLAFINEGKLVQYGTVNELIDTPANKLTAQFLCPMGYNYFEVKDNFLGINLTSEVKAIGFRPEAIHLDPSSSLEAEVLSTETINDAIYAQLKVGNYRLTGLFHEPIQPNTYVRITIDNNKLHLY